MRFLALFAFIPSVLISSPKPAFTISALEGFELTHTEGEKVREAYGFIVMPDKIAGDIVIMHDEENAASPWSISYQGETFPLQAVKGGRALTFLELHGGNNYMWTVCKEPTKDGSLFVIMTANLTDGLLGVRSKTFRGKAKVT